MIFGFHAADHGLDGGATSQFTLDEAEDAAPLSRDEDAARILRIVAAVSFVDIGALDPVPRTFRDNRETAFEAARYAKSKAMGDIIEIIDRATGAKLIMLEDGRTG